MQCFVGTSGWLYSWNKEGTLDWYITNSGLNAIELNASFYRFPFPNQVVGWSRKGVSLAWVIKANRLITHVHMLNEKAELLYARFIELFKPLDEHIALYLFQMPPNFTSNMQERLVKFAKKFNAEKIAFEFRHESWYSFDFKSLDFSGAIVSPDSPEINRKVFVKNGIAYLRFHGRRSWYSYNYSRKELEEMAAKAKALRPKKTYAFFNNDHDMLNNAQEFMRLLGD
ncbi:MAG: DUF72 domain-containing protein [Candidatus Micrarchaeaceae archaeon]